MRSLGHGTDQFDEARPEKRAAFFDARAWVESRTVRPQHFQHPWPRSAAPMNLAHAVRRSLVRVQVVEPTLTKDEPKHPNQREKI
jgi:hypothetical protein